MGFSEVRRASGEASARTMNFSSQPGAMLLSEGPRVSVNMSDAGVG